MAKNKLSDLRNHLFETLEALKDEERPMDLDRAKAIVGVSNAIIDSAKVEVEMVKAISNSALDPSAFFDGSKDRLLAEPKKEESGGSGLRPPLRIAEGRR